jgi:amino acid transporter
LATALVKTNFAFAGWNNAFNVIGEVRTRDPVRTVRKAGLLSLLLIACLFSLSMLLMWQQYQRTR